VGNGEDTNDDFGHGYDMSNRLDRDAATELARAAKAARTDPRYIESIELTYAELRHVILAMGFEIVSERQIQSSYVGDPMSMMKTQYDSILFTARKPSNDGPDEAGARPTASGIATPSASHKVLWRPDQAAASLQLGALPVPVVS